MNLGDLCDYCDNEATTSWDAHLSNVRIRIRACDEHVERAKLQQEAALSKEDFHNKLNAEADRRGWIASHGI